MMILAIRLIFSYTILKLEFTFIQVLFVQVCYLQNVD